MVCVEIEEWKVDKEDFYKKLIAIIDTTEKFPYLFRCDFSQKSANKCKASAIFARQVNHFIR